VEELGATSLVGDVLDPESLDRLVAGTSWVFHVAGVNEMCSPNPTLMDRVNIEGTGNVVAACRQADVGRLIATSSAVTIGEDHGTVGDEMTAHRGAYLSRYERSKHLAEMTLFSDAGDLDVVAVNPSSVQGPGRATGTAKLILDVINGRLPFLYDTHMSIVDIDDCARGHLLAAENGQRGERYVLSGETISMRDAVAILERVAGRSLDVRYPPAWMLRIGAAAVEFGARVTGRTPPVCREMVKVMLAGHAYDSSRATLELGLAYTPLEDTMRRTFEWFEAEGLLEARR
jgi:dihydroflavonol-4-reductase